MKMPFLQLPEPLKPASRKALFLWIAILFLILSCNLTAVQSSEDATRVALMVEQTRLAGTVAVLTRVAENPASTPLVDPTRAVESTPLPVMTEQPLPEFTPENLPPDVERHIRAARILLFENMSASGYVRLVKEALDQANYFYQDVGSATGWFKTLLTSDQEWDLVIASVEADRDFGGDYFLLLDQQVEKGASEIVEFWNYDAAPYGMPDNLLKRCGVEFEADWVNPDLRVFYWLDRSNPIFNQPNQIPNLRNAAQLWKDDIGDLLKIRMKGGKPVGDAQILASTNPGWDTNHGVLVSCLNGRVILQTFRSHEYQALDMIRLWQNYVYQTLKARFLFNPSNAPTPGVAFQTAVETPTLPAERTVSPPGTEFACGEAFSVQLTTQPRFQKDLFEHHADGTFLILNVQVTNLTTFPLQIWDGDYFVTGSVNGRPVTLSPHKAATGYLYVDSPHNLIQDVIPAGAKFNIALAFDVDPNGAAWDFIFKPGFEYHEQVCEVRIPLTP
jgi:hypothetical protein